MRDSWMWQGRQDHGWFGHGTAPDRDDSEEGGSDSNPNADNWQSNIIAATRAAVGALPVESRSAFERALSTATLGRIVAVFGAWQLNAMKTDVYFNSRFLEGAVPAQAGAALRDAARFLALPGSPDTQRAAAERIAETAQLVGPDRFAQTVAALFDRTIAYVDDAPRRWLGQASVGTGHCVPLVQAATAAPHTSGWRQGPKVQGNSNIAPGSAIATFSPDGLYTNSEDRSSHAAIYLGQDAEGISVIDQWLEKRKDGSVFRVRPSVRKIPFAPRSPGAVNDGRAFHVVR